jgi:pectin methylesterase-like acyl-CoA thioesterase
MRTRSSLGGFAPVAVLTVPKLFAQSGGMVRYVNNPDPTCRGHAPCYSTIQAAVDAVQPGDTIRIQPGQYKESVLIQGICQS